MYAVDEIPPGWVLFVSAAQHVALMATSLVYPIILGHEAGLAPLDLSNFISLSMLVLGAATVLMGLRTGIIGSGYLVPAAYSQIFLGPALFAAQRGGMALVATMAFFTGTLQLAMAPLLRRMRALLPPEIAGLVIAIVGLSNAVLGVQYGLGIRTMHEVRPDYAVVALLSLLTMVGLNIWTKGFTRIFSMLFGITVGYAASAGLNILDVSSVQLSGAPILRVPPMVFLHWSFDGSMLAPFVVVALAGSLHLMGNISNAQKLNDADWVRPDFASLTAGLAATGLASAMSGIAGAAGVNAYSSSVGLSAATGITSRVIAYGIGGLLAVLALFPVAAASVATLPPPVVGASLFFTAAFVFVNGLQMITARLLDARKIMVIGFSFAAAITADLDREFLHAAPAVLQPILGSSLVLGTLCAVLLNLAMRVGVGKRVAVEVEPGARGRVAVEKFMTEQGAHWAARHDVVHRASFAIMQLLDILNDPPDGVELEASFDEFNLDVRLRYIGDVLSIPERRPATHEIIESDDGERLLAGYLLRQSADRITSRVVGRFSEVALHYDH